MAATRIRVVRAHTHSCAVARPHAPLWAILSAHPAPLLLRGRERVQRPSPRRRVRASHGQRSAHPGDSPAAGRRRDGAREPPRGRRVERGRSTPRRMASAPDHQPDGGVARAEDGGPARRDDGRDTGPRQPPLRAGQLVRLPRRQDAAARDVASIGQACLADLCDIPSLRSCKGQCEDTGKYAPRPDGKARCGRATPARARTSATASTQVGGARTLQSRWGEDTRSSSHAP